MHRVIISEAFDEAGVSRYHRAYLAGHLSLSSCDFLVPFGMAAILVLIFITLLHPLLVLGPLHSMDWLLDKSKFSLLCKLIKLHIHIFLDTFHGYKPTNVSLVPRAPPSRSEKGLGTGVVCLAWPVLGGRARADTSMLKQT